MKARPIAWLGVVLWMHLAMAVAAAPKPRVAVFPFKSEVERFWSTHFDPGRVATAAVTSELVNSGGYEVVDREHLDMLKSQPHFKLVGARYFVTGTVMELKLDTLHEPPRLRVGIRVQVTDVDSGLVTLTLEGRADRVGSGAVNDALMYDTIRTAAEQVVSLLNQQMGVSPSPAADRSGRPAKSAVLLLMPVDAPGVTPFWQAAYDPGAVMSKLLITAIENGNAPFHLVDGSDAKQRTRAVDYIVFPTIALCCPLDDSRGHRLLTVMELKVLDSQGVIRCSAMQRCESTLPPGELHPDTDASARDHMAQGFRTCVDQATQQMARELP